MGDAVALAHQRLYTLLDELDDQRLREPSLLPGWTRGHVLAHLTDNARAFERQTRAALRGDLAEMYDGGQRGRDQSIERNARSSLADLRLAVLESSAALDRLCRGLAAEDLGRRVRFRDGTVADVLQARWREVEIHGVDLGLTYTARDWPLDFAVHALEFLAGRVLAGTALVLQAEDAGVQRTFGRGQTVAVTGPLRDIVSWMAGRGDGRSLRCSASELPQLGPWPPDPTA